MQEEDERERESGGRNCVSDLHDCYEGLHHVRLVTFLVSGVPHCVSGGLWLCIFLVLCVQLYVLRAANSISFSESLDLSGLNNY